MPHRNVFRYICAFLREILAHSDKNKSNAKILAQIFGDVLLKPQLPEVGPTAKGAYKKRQFFVYQFLTNDFDDSWSRFLVPFNFRMLWSYFEVLVYKHYNYIPSISWWSSLS